VLGGFLMWFMQRLGDAWCRCMWTRGVGQAMHGCATLFTITIWLPRELESGAMFITGWLNHFNSNEFEHFATELMKAAIRHPPFCPP